MKVFHALMIRYTRLPRGLPFACGLFEVKSSRADRSKLGFGVGLYLKHPD